MLYFGGLNWKFSDEDKVPGWTRESLELLLKEKKVETEELPTEVATEIIDRMLDALAVDKAIKTGYDKRIRSGDWHN